MKTNAQLPLKRLEGKDAASFDIRIHHHLQQPWITAEARSGTSQSWRGGESRNMLHDVRENDWIGSLFDFFPPIKNTPIGGRYFKRSPIMHIPSWAVTWKIQPSTDYLIKSIRNWTSALSVPLQGMNSFTASCSRCHRNQGFQFRKRNEILPGLVLIGNGYCNIEGIHAS